MQNSCAGATIIGYISSHNRKRGRDDRRSAQRDTRFPLDLCRISKAPSPPRTCVDTPILERVPRPRCNNNGVHLRPRQEAWEGGPEELVTATPPPPGPVQDIQGPQPAVRTCVDTAILERVPRLHPHKDLTGAMGCARRRHRAGSRFCSVARRAAGGRRGGTALSLPLCTRKPRPISILETALQGVASKL